MILLENYLMHVLQNYVWMNNKTLASVHSFNGNRLLMYVYEYLLFVCLFFINDYFYYFIKMQPDCGVFTHFSFLSIFR